MTDNACQAQAFGWPGGGLGPRVLPWRPALCGAEARDALWAHPDLLPGPDDLADPLGFIEESATELDFGLDEE